LFFCPSLTEKASNALVFWPEKTFEEKIKKMNSSFYSRSFEDLNHYETVARVLAKELSSFRLTSDPLDVAETLEQLTEEMETMPGVIKDCRLAAEAFGELESVLDRMYSLADRAVELKDSNPLLLSAMNEEFGGYSHIIARLAGADDFSGPCLSLLTSEEAKVTRVILSCLSAASQNLAYRLEEQRRHINSAMDDAINLLLRILDEGDGISYETRLGLSSILERLRDLDENFVSPDERPARAYLLN
jgi:hypothetical protein